MLHRWHKLSLQIKMTVMISLIIGAFAMLSEWLESQLIQHTVEDNVRNAALAVGRSVDQNVASLSQLTNREARTKELEEILSNLPDLLNIMLYEFPVRSEENPVPIGSAGPTNFLLPTHPQQMRARELIQQVREERHSLIDYADRSTTDRKSVV